mmetsp:Transcript_17439/g.46505  ORF Transcript_17439/g.46505 Transcript_17439/m.46505 type:complete len:86 (+) Transcript_17439:636-893(+)
MDGYHEKEAQDFDHRQVRMKRCSTRSIMDSWRPSSGGETESRVGKSMRRSRVRWCQVYSFSWNLDDNDCQVHSISSVHCGNGTRH